ncbi:hypothetical protein SSS_10776, partial [Sarcoptes scabiei]
ASSVQSIRFRSIFIESVFVIERIFVHRSPAPITTENHQKYQQNAQNTATSFFFFLNLSREKDWISTKNHCYYCRYLFYYFFFRSTIVVLLLVVVVVVELDFRPLLLFFIVVIFLISTLLFVLREIILVLEMDVIGDLKF